MSMYVDFHVLQTVPPSCVNRDDTGSPKTAIYGGAVRARVSSQAWKHAMRTEFRNLFAAEELGKRTKDIVTMVAEEICVLDSTIDEKKAEKKASDALKAAGISLKAKGDEIEKADALFFMSTRQAKEVARLACEDSKDKEVLKNAMKENPSVDIALFGRMAASDPTLNYDAASQVAHAISTHAVQNEYDYFTAVDDMQKEDNAGAGHLGTVEFNSSTLYRYANVNVSELVKTLGETSDVASVVRKFAEAFIRSMPTGKENTFANRTFPDAVYVTIRRDQPVNLCGAFEKPVRSNGGYAEESEKRLAEYAEKMYTMYAANPEYAFCIGDSLAGIAKMLPLSELLNTLEETIRICISEG